MFHVQSHVGQRACWKFLGSHFLKHFWRSNFGGLNPSEKYAHEIGSFLQGLGWTEHIVETTT